MEQRGTAPGKVPIGDARRIARERACPMVVIFAVEPSGERFTVTTYGATKTLCRVAAAFGEQIAQAIFAGTVGPPETEPLSLPDTPVIYTGHRKEGT